ncbi:MAG: DNA repair protein RecN [Oscillospiraceae bacterium]|nr:DNA repair protein RecN [Oscillospiraceae bacterium]
MLRLLHIENIAVIERADILFEDGFNVMTGETGAGKSIVIDAISAILGERAYRDMIRTGMDKASVRAVFDRVPALAWFAENEIPYEDEITVQREIHLDGKNVCRVNGMPISVGVLKKLGIQLINIHGQHDSAALFDENYHLSFLDGYACNEALLSDYAQKYQAVQTLKREIDRLAMDEGEKLRRMETLKYQIDEISRAELKAGEDETLEAQRRLAQNAEKLSDGLRDAATGLDGDDESEGAASLLARAERALGKIAKYDDSLAQLHDTVADLMYQTQDAAEQLRDKIYTLSYSAEELERIEERLDVIFRLRRKYGATCEDILAYMQRAKAELEEIEFADERMEQLRNKLKSAEKAAWDAAKALRASRKQAAVGLTERVLQELSDLDMKNVQFACEFSETELSPNGADAVAFYMSANLGEALKPLNKVASGGELARIMLALKNVLAQRDRVPTLIFDEVDTGVSGRAAQHVAEKLKSVSKNKQVLCVTHLPQLAALADTHFLIEKSERDGRTFTAVTPLDFEGRKRELARIIGGANITETTLQSAAEMLQ